MSDFESKIVFENKDSISNYVNPNTIVKSWFDLELQSSFSQNRCHFISAHLSNYATLHYGYIKLSLYYYPKQTVIFFSLNPYFFTIHLKYALDGQGLTFYKLPRKIQGMLLF